MAYSLSQVVIVWVVSQVFKTGLKLVTNKQQFYFKMLFDDGDFPSTHTAVTITATISTFYNSYIFVNEVIQNKFQMASFVCFITSLLTSVIVSAFVVIRDAGGVRRDVDKNGELQKQMAESIATIPNTEVLQNIFSEIARSVRIKNGHMPHEIIGGIILAAIVEAWFILFNTVYLVFVIVGTLLYVIITFIIFIKRSHKLD
jgi:acid phosphatase family membrane protein YuiD